MHDNLPAITTYLKANKVCLLKGVCVCVFGSLRFNRFKVNKIGLPTVNAIFCQAGCQIKKINRI